MDYTDKPCNDEGIFNGKYPMHKFYRIKKSIYVLTLIAVLSVLVFALRVYRPIEPVHYSDIKSFRVDFLNKFPVGTSEEIMDDYYISELSYIKSARWHYGEGTRGVAYALGEDNDYYFLSYINSDPFDYNSIGYFFTLKFSLNGELLSAESIGGKGALFTKIQPTIFLSLFEKPIK